MSRYDPELFWRQIEPWRPCTIWIPRRINQRWYWPGSTVYRRFRVTPGGGYYTYGTVFDYLRDQ